MACRFQAAWAISRQDECRHRQIHIDVHTKYFRLETSAMEEKKQTIDSFVYVHSEALDCGIRSSFVDYIMRQRVYNLEVATVKTTEQFYFWIWAEC